MKFVPIWLSLLAVLLVGLVIVLIFSPEPLVKLATTFAAVAFATALILMIVSARRGSGNR